MIETLRAVDQVKDKYAPKGSDPRVGVRMNWHTVVQMTLLFYIIDPADQAFCTVQRAP